MRPGFLIAPLFLVSLACAGEPIDLGGRRALLVDDFLIDRGQGVALTLHPPVRRETVFHFDAPWEGNGTEFMRVIRVGNVIRMYYDAGQFTVENGRLEQPLRSCVIESVDGVHWVRPDLGIFDFNGSKDNNIVWSRPRLDNFTAFRDTNPACPPDERYKALDFADPPTPDGTRELYALKSADGFHWSPLSKKPILSNEDERGLAFDTENNAFWDPVRKHYWAYVRGYHYQNGQGVTDVRNGTVGIRDIRVSTSADFRTWTRPRMLAFDGPYVPALYTNQIEPYGRSPGLFVGFPTRYNDRVKDFTPAAMAALPNPTQRKWRMKFVPRYGTVITDGMFMTSRDGYHFHLWDEAFIPPGPEWSNNWLYGDGYQSLGLLEIAADDPTASPEFSCYAWEGHWIDETLRRYTMRIDGFVSVHAPLLPGGDFVTKPLVFAGRRLSLNFATSAAGTVRVELEGEDGNPIPGFEKPDCDPIFGDALDRTVTWRNRSDVGTLAGRPVRIHVFLNDADLYSLGFGG